jgi:hypothetical protein
MKRHSSHECTHRCSRRDFLKATGSASLLPPFLNSIAPAAETVSSPRIAPAGPASKYTPSIRAAFVRRRGDYGILWPGAIYDGATALVSYRNQIEKASRDLGLKMTVRPEPIYSTGEADAWLAEAKGEGCDGLLVVLLDRQQHAWPTAARAIDSGVPSLVFAPVGSAFTTNTGPLAKKTGTFIASTDDFGQVVYGLRMIRAGARLRETRFVVLAGNERKDVRIDSLGTRLRYLPARSFLDEYEGTSIDDEIREIAAEYIRNATFVSGPSEQDVLNGVKSYVVARKILEREEGDGITMDCLGALGNTRVSLPCIAWSRMLDHGVPAACEADLGASLTHAVVQYLFDRPGFQQDPVPETSKEALIGAHCTCPTRLDGFAASPAPYYLSHHHGMRDAVPRPEWRVGQRVTVAVIGGLNDPNRLPPHMYISSGSVLENVAVPPAGGCVVSVSIKVDGVSEVLDYPGFHQLFFYGDYKKQLREFCRLYGLEARVV